MFSGHADQPRQVRHAPFPRHRARRRRRAICRATHGTESVRLRLDHRRTRRDRPAARNDFPGAGRWPCQRRLRAGCCRSTFLRRALLPLRPFMRPHAATPFGARASAGADGRPDGLASFPTMAIIALGGAASAAGRFRMSATIRNIRGLHFEADARRGHAAECRVGEPASGHLKGDHHVATHATEKASSARPARCVHLARWLIAALVILLRDLRPFFDPSYGR